MLFTLATLLVLFSDVLCKPITDNCQFVVNYETFLRSNPKKAIFSQHHTNCKDLRSSNVMDIEPMLKAIPTNCKVTLLMHGFKTGRDELQHFYDIKDGLFNLKNGPFKKDSPDVVIIVEWTAGNQLNIKDYWNWFGYEEASKNAMAVSDDLADLIKVLGVRKDVDQINIHLIGFSLGAHAVAKAASIYDHRFRKCKTKCPYVAIGVYDGCYRHCGNKIGRVTGLDPAGPRFRGQLN